MKVKNVNLEDPEFREHLKKYLVESQPYKGFSDMYSKKYIENRLSKFIESDLSKNDIANSFISEHEETLFYLFCKKDKTNKKLEIILPFPNINLFSWTSFTRWPFAFCHLMLHQMNELGINESFGTIERKNKSSTYEKSLIRFGSKMFEVTDEPGQRFKKVTVKKENLIKAHKKLKPVYARLYNRPLI